jgi:hypothetical protein
MTVFRGIPALTPRGTQLSVGPVVRDDLSPGATYWVREGGRSVPYAFPWTELDATTMQPLTQEQLHPAR